MSAGPTRRALAELIARGASDEEAGRRFGLSKSAIRRLRRRWAIPAHRNSRGWPAAPGAAALRWRRGDLSERQIAKLYGGQRYDRATGSREPDQQG